MVWIHLAENEDEGWSFIVTEIVLEDSNDSEEILDG